MGRIGKAQGVALEARLFWGDRLLESTVIEGEAIVRAPPGLVVEVRRGEDERWRGPVAALGPGAVARIEDGPLVREFRRIEAPAAERIGLARDFDLGLARRLAVAALATLAVVAASFVVGLEDPGLVDKVLPAKWVHVIPMLPRPRPPQVVVLHRPAPDPDSFRPRPTDPPARLADRRARDEQLIGDRGLLRALRDLDGGGAVFSSLGGSTGINAAVNELRTGGTGPADVGGLGGLGPRGGPGVPGGPLSVGRLTGDGAGARPGFELGVSSRRDAVRVSPGKVTVVGGLSKDVIGKTIRSLERQVLACYERELQKDPNLEGKLAVSFVIDGAGTVAEVTVQEDTLASPSVGRCVEAKIRGWRFPAPEGGGQVIVHYPWIFRAAGAE